ncbi:hypothetical protein [Stappia sp. BW2]|uniref:hypothetical protein n=1 Tax=Stappia sp. BW2 TaxID=2592622 RepID=UPI001AD8AD0D|nr:hypothetical protein [Stappia sp. BW2]
MTIRNTFLAPLFRGLAVAVLLVPAAIAQEKVAPETADAVTKGQANRFSLVKVDEDILRVDRQNGTVSICKEQSDAWRCNPVPLAEEAYLAEINELAGEVDRLTARLEELEGKGGKSGKQLPPGSALDRPAPKPGEGGRSPSATEEDEELEKVLTFTESAMRRFFGMVRDLQKDFEGDGN